MSRLTPVDAHWREYRTQFHIAQKASNRTLSRKRIRLRTLSDSLEKRRAECYAIEAGGEIAQTDTCINHDYLAEALFHSSLF